jgi:hypothetical protein
MRANDVLTGSGGTVGHRNVAGRNPITGSGGGGAAGGMGGGRPGSAGSDRSVSSVGSNRSNDSYRAGTPPGKTRARDGASGDSGQMRSSPRTSPRPSSAGNICFQTCQSCCFVC